MCPVLGVDQGGAWKGSAPAQTVSTRGSVARFRWRVYAQAYVPLRSARQVGLATRCSPVAYATPRTPPDSSDAPHPATARRTDVHPTSTRNSGVAECPISSDHLTARRDPSRQQPEYDRPSEQSTSVNGLLQAESTGIGPSPESNEASRIHAGRCGDGIGWSRVHRGGNPLAKAIGVGNAAWCRPTKKGNPSGFPSRLHSIGGSWNWWAVQGSNL